MSDDVHMEDVLEAINEYAASRLRRPESIDEIQRYKDTLRNMVQSIIFERDALRAAMKSHRKELR